MIENMESRDKGKLDRIREAYRNREGWRCLGLCVGIIGCDAKGEECCSGTSMEVLRSNTREALSFIERQTPDDLKSDEKQEVLYCLGISLARVGYHQEARKFFDATVKGTFGVLSQIGLNLCDFICDSIESTKGIPDCERTTSGPKDIGVVWYQSVDDLILSISVEAAPAESIRVQAEERLINIFVALRDNVSYLYDIPFPGHEIEPEDFRIHARKRIVEIKFRKKEKVPWDKLQVYSGTSEKIGNLVNEPVKSPLDHPVPLYKKVSLIPSLSAREHCRISHVGTIL